MASPARSVAAVAEILRDAGLLEELRGPGDVVVEGVSQDSRSVERGDLFLAWRGTESDAHDYVVDAAAAGASAAVVERFVSAATLPQLRVSNGRLAAAVAADAVLGSPWEELFAVGVTGTNGKTTTTLLARHLLGALGPSAALGTLGLVDADGTVRPGTEALTTPGPVRIAEWLADLVGQGARSVSMEASSHALEQRRLDGVRFDAGVFTNLSREHLDYHGSWEAYRGAKARLAELLKSGGVVVVNADDPEWQRLPDTGARRLTFGLEGERDLRGDAVEPHAGGIRFRMSLGEEAQDVELPLLGRFNVENALAAAGAAVVAELSLAEIAERLATVPQVPGRLERLISEPFTVVIDFAHTADALENVLRALRPLVDGRLIVVFGAGGDRDRSKRPEMGRVVSRLADLIVVTSDNPRTEDPGAIVDEIVAGVEGSEHLRIVDRREAIHAALEHAEPGDLVLLAGKGHERYQILGTEKHPFDERVVVREALDLPPAGGGA